MEAAVDGREEGTARHLEAASKELATWLESIPLDGIDDLKRRLGEVDRACKEGLPDAFATAIETGEAREQVQAALGLKKLEALSAPRFASRGGQRTVGKKPDERQLADIRARGTFEIGDEDEKGVKPDVWRVSRLLQTGTEVRRGWYYALLITAVDQIWVQPSNRVSDRRGLSVASGIRHVWKGLTGIANGLVGVRLEGFNARAAVKDIQLDRRAACRASAEPLVDIRLFDDNTREFLHAQWTRIAAARASAWATREESAFVEETIRSVREKHAGNQEVSEEAIAAEVRALSRAEEARRLAAAVSSDAMIEKDSPGLGAILARHVEAAWALSAASAELQTEQQKVQTARLEELQKNNPVLVHVYQWKSGKLARAIDTWRTGLQWRPLEQAEAIVGAIGPAEARLFATDKTWRQEKLRALKADAAAARKYKFPLHTVSDSIRIWRPKNYWVDLVTIDDIASRRAHEPPRHPEIEFGVELGRHAHYSLREYDQAETATDGLFWRFRLVAQRTRRNFKNGVHFFWGSVWNGPLGLRALFSPFPFDVYIWDVNSNGIPYKRIKGQRPTIITRLCGIWSHVFSSRQRFESEPARGLIGKGLARPFNLVWNYLVIGALGTALVCAVIPLATAAAVAASLFLLVTCPGWAPGLALLEYFLNVFLWDSVTGEYAPVLSALFWDIGLAGVFNILASLVFAVFHPVIGAAVFVAGGLGLGVVAAWDWLIFWGLLRWHARIPGSDTFLCRRIAGTGIAQTYYVQVAPAAVLLALRLKLQQMLLEAHQDSLFWDANSSVREATKVTSFLQEMGLTVALPTGLGKKGAERTGSRLGRIVQRASVMQGAIQQEFLDRFRKLDASPRLDGNRWNKVRLTREDLDRTIPIAEDMVRRFGLERLLPLKSKTGTGKGNGKKKKTKNGTGDGTGDGKGDGTGTGTESANGTGTGNGNGNGTGTGKGKGTGTAGFWRNEGLTENDWTGLTRKLLAVSVADGVLTPLEEDTEAIHLQVDHVTPKEFVRMLVDDRVHDDLEIARVVEPRSKSAGAARLRWRDAGGRDLACGLGVLGEESVQVWPVDGMDGLIEELSRYTPAGGMQFDNSRGTTCIVTNHT